MNVGLPDGMVVPSHEAVEQAKMDAYFERNRSGIQNTVSFAAKNTQHGREKLRLLLPDPPRLTLHSFLELPQILPEDLAGNPTKFLDDVSAADSLGASTVSTSGSSSVRKEITHSDSDFVAPLDPSLIDFIRSSNHPILLQDRESDVDYKMIKHGIEAGTGKPIDVRGFTFPNEAIAEILSSNADAIYLSLSPTLARVLLRGWEELYEKSDPGILSLRGKTLLLDLSSEPVSIGELEKWSDLLDKVFGEIRDPGLSRIVSIYGQTEHLQIGKYRYKKGDSEIRYEVRDGKFCLILDENGRPIVGKEGKLEVTSLGSSPQALAGTTVIPRYVTGDLAIADIDETGRLFLKNIRRDPERGIISVLGEKIFLDTLPAQLDECGFSDVQLEFQVLGIFPRQIIQINLCSRNFGDQEDPRREEATEAMKGVLTQGYPDIQPAIVNGGIKIKISTSDDLFRKRWRLLPPGEINEDDYMNTTSDILPEDFNKPEDKI